MIKRISLMLMCSYVATYGSDQLLDNDQQQTRQGYSSVASDIIEHERDSMIDPLHISTDISRDNVSYYAYATHAVHDVIHSHYFQMFATRVLSNIASVLFLYSLYYFSYKK